MNIKAVACCRISVVCGFYVYVFWLSGSHGHLQFRPQMTSDWILSGLLSFFLGLPLLLIIRFIIRTFFVHH